MSFVDELASRGVLTEEQVAQANRRAKEKHNGDIDAALLEMGMAEGDLMAAKASYYNVPYKTVDPKAVSFDLLKYIPEDSAKHYSFVPIGKTEGVLEVGMTDPDNMQGIDALQFITAKNSMPFKIFLISKKDFEAVLNNYQGLTGEVDQALSDLDSSIADASEAESVVIEDTKVQDSLKPGEESRLVEDAPIIKIVAVIIRHATEGNASDIHIENTGDKVKVRFRVDGILHTSLVLPLNVYSGVVARIKILAKLRLDEKRKPQDGSFSARIDGRKIDFRVSTMPSYYGEKVVMRILDSEKGVKPLDSLGMTPENLALVREAIKKPYGLILITGPTGSGKTTTLYSMLNEVDRESSNVVSLEDPVEYQIPGMNQSQVMPEIGYTFANGLRSILRQDPDILMVGEIRDKETAQLAIQAALTGHLVFSTLHTNSAIGAIPRLVDMGVDPYLIAPTLILTMAQRLVRTICEGSQKEIPMDESTKILIEKQIADLPDEFKKNFIAKEKMYEAAPSAECPSGTRGRMSVYEMFKVDKEIQEIILKNPTEQAIYEAVRRKGMVTMREDAILKNLEGRIPFQEVYNLAANT